MQGKNTESTGARRGTADTSFLSLLIRNGKFQERLAFEKLHLPCQFYENMNGYQIFLVKKSRA